MNLMYSQGVSKMCCWCQWVSWEKVHQTKVYKHLWTNG